MSIKHLKPRSKREVFKNRAIDFFKESWQNHSLVIKKKTIIKESGQKCIYYYFTYRYQFIQNCFAWITKKLKINYEHQAPQAEIETRSL